MRELSILHIANAYARDHYGLFIINGVDMIDPNAWKGTGLLSDEVEAYLQVARLTRMELKATIVKWDR